MTERKLNLNTLKRCLNQDPNLASISPDMKCNIFKTLFITSGCDYISYFSGHGKATFIEVFCQNAQFICGTEMEGCLSETGSQDKHKGFLAFLRLVGCLYFKKHWSSFATQHSCETPRQLFESVLAETVKKRHEMWINMIREIVSERILSEEERIPSTSALERHWNRTCWVSQFWQNAVSQDVKVGLPLPEESGWMCQEDGCYAIGWDSIELQERVKGTVEFLTKGCSCKKSKCITSQCSCRKQQKNCGPACKCMDCGNNNGHVENSRVDQSEDDTYSDEDHREDENVNNYYSDDDESGSESDNCYVTSEVVVDFDVMMDIDED